MRPFKSSTVKLVLITAVAAVTVIEIDRCSHRPGRTLSLADRTKQFPQRDQTGIENGTYIPGLGFYDTHAHRFFALPYGFYIPGKGYFASGEFESSNLPWGYEYHTFHHAGWFGWLWGWSYANSYGRPSFVYSSSGSYRSNRTNTSNNSFRSSNSSTIRGGFGSRGGFGRG